LLIHGRDDKVVPLETSLRLQQWIDGSQLHIYGGFGHSTQIEHATGFTQQVMQFLKKA